MNKLCVCLCMLLALSCTNSGDEVPNIKLGPATGYIYFMVEGELKEVHRAVLEIPADGGRIEYELLSYGITTLIYKGDNIKLSQGRGFPIVEDEFYDVDEMGVKRYLQSVIIEAQPNDSNDFLEVKCLIFAGDLVYYAAEFTIRQAGR